MQITQKQLGMCWPITARFYKATMLQNASLKHDSGAQSGNQYAQCTRALSRPHHKTEIKSRLLHHFTKMVEHAAKNYQENSRIWGVLHSEATPAL